MEVNILNKQNDYNLVKQFKIMGPKITFRLHSLILLFVLFLITLGIGYKYLAWNLSNKPSGLQNPTAPKQSTSLCTRNNPYPMQPEFERALSLIIQRNYQNSLTQTVNYAKSLESIKNCLSVVYKDTGEAEGYFTFDQTQARNDFFPIYVSNKYQYTDDISTALLFSHELAHVFQFINEKFYNNKIDCYSSEVNAFYGQYIFILILNPEEKRTITSRWEGSVSKIDKNPQIQITKQLSIMGYESARACNMETIKAGDSCWDAKFTKYIEDMVKSNPYYQKQCAHNATIN